MTTQPTVTIDAVSDILCPWCFIGKRRLAKALDLVPDIPVTTRWRPFQLDDTLPPEGKDYRQYHDDKFGSPHDVDALRSRVIRAGAEEGIPFAFDKVVRAPNTLNAHRLIRWAGPAGVQDALVERLFSLLFVEGADLTQLATLAGAAAACDLDFDHAMELLASDQDVETVREDVGLARRMGVNSVPCFIVDNRYAVLGAQPPETIADAIRQAAAEKVEEAPYISADLPQV